MSIATTRGDGGQTGLAGELAFRRQTCALKRMAQWMN